MYEEIVKALKFTDSQTYLKYYAKEALELMADAADAIDALAAENRAMRNELCLYCGKYKTAHLGACDGCRFKEDK